MMVVCDPFVGWTEAGKLPVLNLHKTTAWFHQDITCQYVIPKVVHRDGGPE